MPDSSKPRPRLLVINPNSNTGMTSSLHDLLQDRSEQVDIHYFTAPSGPASINNDEDAQESLFHCAPELLKSGLLETHDAFIVACYSRHPLTAWIDEYFASRAQTRQAIGIFQASVAQCLHLLQHEDDVTHAQYGIVSTGDYWEQNLTQKVSTLAMPGARERFAGVSTTGLTAKELHDLSKDQVSSKMVRATKKLIRRGHVKAICLGCAGMAGLNDIVRQACEEELGVEEGRAVHIVDGTLAALSVFQRSQS